ncbi:disulfide oxidoreductase [Tuberibacillus sp. Marseille-P3662]|uniref:disulfide oxidoreductase n=1 Tax=Tuberibacillus sp. Marseille-P3662 TaxID=1965358 RepID=UPI000A1CD5E2|nr:disulfide oxidoreductase [Tuberibacillus sp. Marseille-P3662]
MNDSGLNGRLYGAWLVAIIATVGSLYFSEIAGFLPCKLCWFQRICMYPMVILLGIACFKNDRGMSVYLLPLTVIGGLISILHLAEQHLGLFQTICTGTVPCSGKYIQWLGFMTIPLLALMAFILVSVMLWRDWYLWRHESKERS